LRSAEKGVPLCWGENEGWAVGVLAVSDGHDARKVGGHLNALAAVVTARGGLAPLCPVEAHCLLVHRSIASSMTVRDCLRGSASALMASNRCLISSTGRGSIVVRPVRLLSTVTTSIPFGNRASTTFTDLEVVDLHVAGNG